PAAVLIGAALASTLWLLGGAAMFMLLLAAVLPALYVSRGVALKRPFFEQLRAGIAVYAAGLVGAMLVASASFGGSMVAKFVDILRGEFTRMPDAALQPFVDALNSAMSLYGAGVNELYTVDMYRAQLSGILDLMQQTYAQALPGTLLSGALLSGVLSVLWGNWTVARQGRATNDSFVGLSGWFLPAQITFGMLALWLLGFIIAASGYAAGPTVYATARMLAGACFAIQALCAMDRRMLRAGRELSRRRLLIGILAVAALIISDFAMVLAIVGAASALFGSHGAVRRRVNGDSDDQSDRNDPQI
ncbi:MAG: hypothetical protein IJ769_00515, partial [Clostridia bacterium]|nr:hypothetical protein [Clostridia bacterium]